MVVGVEMRPVIALHEGQRVERAQGPVRPFVLSLLGEAIVPVALRRESVVFGFRAVGGLAEDDRDFDDVVRLLQHFLETLDIETLADTLEEVEPEFQASLLEGMSDERVVDVLEEMQPDEVADLLAELPDERSQELLELMEDEEAADVRKLLEYPEDSAGGIMTTAYITVHQRMTIEEVLTVMREEAEEAELFFYIYVIDEANHLEGVFSLRELVLAQPNTRVADIMETRVVTVNLEDSQDDCAQAVSKYDLIAIPVVDGEGRLCGVVTADDALDKIIPTAWKKRLPHFYT